MVLVLLGCGLAQSVSAASLVSRPDADKGPTRVYGTAFIKDIDTVDTPNQSFEASLYLEMRWQDPRLSHDEQGEVARPLSEVWTPRVTIVNQQRVWRALPEIVEVSPDGEVVYRQQFWGSFSQPLDLKDFPFDRQVLTLQVLAAGYTPDEVAFVRDPDSVSGVTSDPSIPDWEFLDWKLEPKPVALSQIASAGS